MSLASLLKIQPPNHPVKQWHVSAPVDLLGYAFSWAWVFIPLLLLGDARWDYMVYYLLIVAVTDVHRHFGLPYVYMDREIRRRYPIRFYLFPAELPPSTSGQIAEATKPNFERDWGRSSRTGQVQRG